MIFDSSIDFAHKTYGYLKNYKSVYSNISALKYEKIGDLNQTTCFNGDIFITSGSTLFQQYLKSGAPNGGSLTFTKGWFDIDLIYESEINFGLRHSGTGECNNYYKNTNYDDQTKESSISSIITTNLEKGDMSKYLREK